MELPTLGAMMTSLSVATDFAMSHSAHFGVRSAYLAVALARRLGWSEDRARLAHYQALLRYVGCNVDTQLMAALVGDELAIRREVAGVDAADRRAMARIMLRRLLAVHRGEPALQATVGVVRAMLTAEARMAEFFAGHCEVGQRLGERIGLPKQVVTSLGQLYERWDGKGQPNHLRGSALSPIALIVSLAQDVVVHVDAGGEPAAREMIRARRGTAHDPVMSDAFLAHAPALLGGLEAVDAGAVPEVPGGDQPLDEERFDRICEAMADFADIKSPWTLGHSTGVARLAAAAAEASRLSVPEIALVRRAGWLHDLGTVGVSAAIWGKATTLNRAEQEQVRLHAYYGDRIVSAAPSLRDVAEAASMAHDRLDGTGYFRRPAPAQISRAARVLAAADVFHALTEARPHRPAVDAVQAARLLRAEARAGRLDQGSCEAVLVAAGQLPMPAQPAVDLTDRETDVLRRLARGRSMKEIARELGIAPKTVDHHLQRIYPKIGVRTRSGATLYAMEKGLTATPLH